MWRSDLPAGCTPAKSRRVLCPGGLRWAARHHAPCDAYPNVAYGLGADRGYRARPGPEEAWCTTRSTTWYEGAAAWRWRCCWQAVLVDRSSFRGPWWTGCWSGRRPRFAQFPATVTSEGTSDALRARALVRRTELRQAGARLTRASIPIAGAPPVSRRSLGLRIARSALGPWARGAPRPPGGASAPARRSLGAADSRPRTAPPETTCQGSNARAGDVPR